MLARNPQKPIMKFVLASLCVSQSVGQIFSRTLVLSDQSNQASSFNFPVSVHDFYNADGYCYVGAASAVADNTFSVSFFKRGYNTFTPLTPANTTLNNVPNQPNPLCGAQINFLSLMVDMPALVKNGDNQRVYFLRALDPSLSVVSSPIVNDAGGLPTGGIVGLATNQPGTSDTVDLSKQLIFAAVQDNSGNFGVNNSGIALLQLVQTMTGNVKNFTLNVADLVAGNSTGNKAMQLNTSTPAVMVTDPLSFITSTTVDMFWDTDLQKLYIALQGQAGAGAQDGMLGVVVASILGNGTSTQLAFQPIIANSALNVPTNNNIIAGVGSNSQVSILKVRTMKTSTGVKYLIVVGGNGSASTVGNQVYAIPLVSLNSTGNPSLLGTVASKNSTPFNGFTGRFPERLIARGFSIPAASNSDLVTSYDAQGLVGAASMFANITDINVVGDTVYVSTSQPGGGQQSGVFYSQAIFNPNGSIANWTPWQRTAGNAQNVFGLQFDVYLSNMIYIQSTNNQATNANSVYTSTWSTGASTFENNISQQLSSVVDGVQGLSSFGPQTLSFNQTPSSRTSLTVMTGYQKVLILQDGEDDANGNFGPNPTFGNIDYFSTDGTLSNFTNSTVKSGLSITGGALESLSAIISSAIGTDGTNGWLFVGGNGGLAVLCDQNGNGWPASPGLSENFVGLNNNLQFKKIGNFSNVRKLVACNGKLYVLTSNSLSRLDLNANLFANNGQFSATNLANPNGLPGGGRNFYFADFIARGSFGILTTSSGLFSSGIGSDISAASNQVNVNWTYVNLNESVGPSTRIFDINFGEQDTGIANLYLINSYVGFNQARVYRMAINSSNSSQVQVYPFNDIFVNGAPTFFINMGTYRNYVFTDGSNLFLSRSRYVDRSPFLELITLNTIFSNPQARNNSRYLYLKIDKNNAVGKLLRTSGSGNYILCGDFGIRYNG